VQVRHFLDEQAKRHCRLLSSQHIADAEMGAGTEGHVTLFLAGDVKCIRIVKVVRIVIGRAPDCHDGEIGDGRGLATALALGADGINMGTRFCATVEAPIHHNVKQFLVDNDERGTNLIFRKFKNTGRVAKSSISDEVVEISLRPESEFKDIQPLVSGATGRVALETGDLDAGLIWAGQIQGLIHDVPTCAELIDRIMTDAEAIIRGRLTRMLG